MYSSGAEPVTFFWGIILAWGHSSRLGVTSSNVGGRPRNAPLDAGRAYCPRQVSLIDSFGPHTVANCAKLRRLYYFVSITTLTMEKTFTPLNFLSSKNEFMSSYFPIKFKYQSGQKFVRILRTANFNP